MKSNYDFSGWATRNDLKCSDGRTIRRNAFKDNDGATVPMVWNHQHNEASNILGHAMLENRDEGVYAYCTFNDTPYGQNAKELVKHGDITALSIYANQLKQIGGDVIHGAIREVSLVLAGANPGAYIDSIIEHSEDGSIEEAVIYSGENIELSHAEETENKEIATENTETKKPESEETVKDVFDTLSDKQKTVVYAIIGQALEDAGVDPEKDMAQSMEDDEDGEDYMKHNVFEGDTDNTAIVHSNFKNVINDLKRYGTMKEAFLAHADELRHVRDDGEIDVSDSPVYTQGYGINPNLDYAFPDYKSLNNPPEFIQRDMGWVSKVMAGVHHTPFSRIKSVFADITDDEARAKGYFKGNLKKYEVFGLLKRTTDPQTVYKKQKLDRDDIIDITNYDVVAWLKGEMRMMLNEELARAYLVGDDRLADSDDKISEDHIRSIWHDNELYSVKVPVTTVSGEAKAKTFIKTAIRARKNYKGSGNPVLFTTEDMLTEMLLLEDGMGHFMYPNESILATTLRVREIITVPIMEEITNPRHDSTANKDYMPLGIIVNLNDYNVGADKGGAVSMFEDFDIDYNQQKYLIETRCSGALIKPKSAIVLEEEYVNP